ncbi:MAG: MIP/aquaporin family protein [Lautropia sp.]|nr:MIP/aquaporin family protein [Lautropia sp.]
MNILTAEIIGTALLILFGNGVVASCSLKHTHATGVGIGWIVITTAWGLAVFVAVTVAGPYSGAHLNPAVTLGLAMIGKTPWADVPTYFAGEMLGGALGALLVWLYFQDQFNATEDEGAKRACFCTGPAIRNLPRNFFCEVVGTFVLVFVVFYIIGNGSITLPGQTEETPIGLGSIGALPVALLVWVIGLSLGSTTGYAINPARDLPPRLVLTLLPMKVNPDWGYAIVPGLGPMVGGALAACAHLALH